MRILHSLPAVLFSMMLTTGVQAQDETGLPGDNFSLEGALEMFKKAGNPEEFEKILNTKENGVNNLDLNNDGDIDYIRVINKKDGNVQLFVLQALVSATESQDVAVIELEKTGDQQAVIQIAGDEDIYGVSKIVEPSDETAVAFDEETQTDRNNGPKGATFAPSGLVVNVWFWPSVRYVYAPYYTVWASPWRWYHYPVWFRPWRPLSWHAYQPICYHYRPRYVVVHTHRITRAPHYYRPMRVSSPSVYSRNRVVVNNYRTNYRNTPRREFDRGNNVNGSTPSRNYERNYDRNSSVNRTSPSRQYDRNTAPGRNSPSRQYDRNSQVNRTPSRQYERNTDVNRPTVPRPVDRTPSDPRVQRQNNRSATIYGPRPDIHRGSSPVNRQPREVNRSSGSYERRSPQRQFDRGSSPAARPQDRQINRSSRPAGNTPQRSMPGRSNRERS